MHSDSYHPPLLFHYIGSMLPLLLATSKNSAMKRETSVKIFESVPVEDVSIIQSACDYVNDNPMDLLILISAGKTASTRTIAAVIPCFLYVRMNKKDKSLRPNSLPIYLFSQFRARYYNGPSRKVSSTYLWTTYGQSR